MRRSAILVVLLLLATPVAARPPAPSAAQTAARQLVKGVVLRGFLESAEGAEAILIVDGHRLKVRKGDPIERKGFTLTVKSVNADDARIAFVDEKGRQAVIALPSAAPVQWPPPNYVMPVSSAQPAGTSQDKGQAQPSAAAAAPEPSASGPNFKLMYYDLKREHQQILERINIDYGNKRSPERTNALMGENERYRRKYQEVADQERATLH